MRFDSCQVFSLDFMIGAGGSLGRIIVYDIILFCQFMRLYRIEEPTVILHQAYTATRAIRISLPKASLATSKLLLPSLNVSSA